MVDAVGATGYAYRTGVIAFWSTKGGDGKTTLAVNVACLLSQVAGKKVLFQSLRGMEGNVGRSLEQLIPRPGFADRILILGPARYPTTEEWNQLHAEVHAGGTLVFAGRLSDPQVDLGPFGAKIKPLRESPPEPAPESPDIPLVDEAGRQAGKQPAESDGESTGEDRKETERLSHWFLKETIAETDLVESRVVWRTQGSLELNSSEWQVLVNSSSKVQVARRGLGKGTIVLLASDDIFSNGVLTDPERALLAVRIIESAPNGSRTWFDETLNSSGVPKVLGILFDPFIRPLTLQFMLITALFGWAGSSRFGPVRQTICRQRRSIVEHARAVGILYSHAGAGAHAVRALHEFLKLELRRLYGTTFRVESAEAISRLAQTGEDEVRTLLNRVRAAESGGLSPSAACQLLRGMSVLISRIRMEK